MPKISIKRCKWGAKNPPSNAAIKFRIPFHEKEYIVLFIEQGILNTIFLDCIFKIELPGYISFQSSNFDVRGRSVWIGKVEEIMSNGSEWMDCFTVNRTYHNFALELNNEVCRCVLPCSRGFGLRLRPGTFR